MLPVDAYLEVQMLGGSPSGAPRQCYGLSCPHAVASRNQIFGIMAVYRLYPIGMPDHYYFPIAAIIFLHANHAIEYAPNGVVCPCFDVVSRVTAA